MTALFFAAVMAGYGGEIVVEVPGGLASLDPAYAWSPAERVAARLLHESPASLLDAPPQMDGLRARLRLRSGLAFHDGSPVDAAAAVRSLERLLRPSPARPPLCPFARGEARAAGPLEIEVRLFAPADLGALLQQPCAAFLPVREPAGGAPAPGAGPFSLASRDGVSLRAEAFAGHVAGRPLLDALRLVTSPLRAGAPAGPPRVVLHPARTVFLVVNPQRADARALAAFAAPLDRADLLRLVKAPAQPLPAPAFTDAPPLPRRTDAATLACDAAEPDPRAVAQRLQLKLHQAGYATRIAAEPLADLLQRLRAGDYDVALVAPPEPGVLAIAVGEDAARGAVPLYAETPRAEVPPTVHGDAADAAGFFPFADLWVYAP